MTAMSDMKTRNNFVWILHRSVCRRWILLLLLALFILFGFSILKRISYNEAKFNWPSSDHRIEIWNFEVNPVGDYLWIHILEGKQEIQADGTRIGVKVAVDGFNFTYRSFAKSKLTELPFQPTLGRVVLILDGSFPNKAQAKLEEAKSFHLLMLILMVHGHPNCKENKWLEPYLKSEGGFVDAIFLTRDRLTINNPDIFPWPIGPSPDFPLFTDDYINVLNERPHQCSYMGDETQLDFHPGPCHLRKAQPNTDENLWDYVQLVSDSDLTACPAGESHRLYEALSLGSVPVLLASSSKEDYCTTGLAEDLRRYHLGLISVKSSYELGDLVFREDATSQQEKIARRAGIINGYLAFRKKIRKEFIRIVQNKSRLASSVEDVIN